MTEETTETTPEVQETKPKNKRGTVKKITDDMKYMASLEERLNQLTGMVESLSHKSAEDEQVKHELRLRLQKQDEAYHPETGPGPACEAYKVHYGEALQLRMTDEPGIYEPVPVGFRVRQHDMIPFLVKEETPDTAPLSQGMVANCRSLYTEEYEYMLPKKPGQAVRQKEKAHLCRKHAKILLGISEDQKAEGLNEVKS